MPQDSPLKPPQDTPQDSHRGGAPSSATLPEMESQLIERVIRGDRAALSRLLTLAADAQSAARTDALAAAITAAVEAATESEIAATEIAATEIATESAGAGAAETRPRVAPFVIALTGGGGVGKSTLLGELATRCAARGERVGVLACDPESPISGGALLGDRCRIAGKSASERIFVRSLSAVSGQQGLARNLALMLRAMKAFGFDRIFVETVGAGQSDVAVRDVADVVVLTLQPQTGDELQWEKAGILEVADLVVVNKSDLPGAERTLAEVTQQLRPARGRLVPIVKTSGISGAGIDELLAALDQTVTARRAAGVASPVNADQPALRAKSAEAPAGAGRLQTRAVGSADPLLEQLADYVCGPVSFSEEAWSTARLCLLDSLGCALLALNYPECAKLLGPMVPGATLRGGARVPGTAYELDPVTAAFNIGCLIRWLDYNDTWLAAEWGHPSDNFGGILATADYLNRGGRRLRDGAPPLTVRDVLAAAIQAYEIQGVLALENAFNRVGLDHVLLVRIATTAVVTQLLGGTRTQVINACSNAWLDGGALRTYRHAPNTGSRKSWAAGDATRRGVQQALWAMAGEMGYATALSAPQWGFEDVVLKKALTVGRPLGCYVMENVLFKVAFPAEFHAQTAAEAAIQLHPQVAGRWDAIDRIRIETQESAMRIISKTGPLRNPADRDHCLQYIVAIALLHGRLDADHYEDSAAADPRVDSLRERMEVLEAPRYTRDYLDPDKRSIANAVQVFFNDGTATERIEIEYPLGHRRRRGEAAPLLCEKFRRNASGRLAPARIAQLIEQILAATDIDALPMNTLMDQWILQDESDGPDQLDPDQLDPDQPDPDQLDPDPPHF